MLLIFLFAIVFAVLGSGEYDPSAEDHSDAGQVAAYIWA